MALVCLERTSSERTAERETANRDAEAQRASEERYAFDRAEERRMEWLDHHRRQAALFEALAAEHREALFELMDLAAKRA